MGEKAKKIKPVKSHIQRQDEMERIMNEFLGLGIPLDHEGCQEFIKVCKLFESEGVSQSGRIRLTGHKRTIEYVFSQQPHVASRARLAYTPEV